MNDVTTTDNEKWISKKEIAEICNCDVRTLTNIIANFKKEETLDIQNHMKKGGYHNSQVFYDDYLVDIIQKQMMINQANQGSASSVVKEATTQAVKKSWYSLGELSQITGYGKDKINHLLVDPTFVQMSKDHSQLGGYHNSQKFYDEYVLKAIKAYQLKAHGNMVNAEKANQSTMNILNKAEQMMDLQIIAESGNVEAMKQFMGRMVAYTEAKAQTKQLQQEKQQLQIENNELQIENHQLQQSLKYDKIKNWKRWSDLKDELKRDCGPFKHRINFNTVIDKSNLVENIDYIITILLNERFPAKMISPIGERKIHDTFQWY